LLINVAETKAEVGGSQRTEVDALAIIDPAIFTQVKNFTEDESPIKLPEDQLFTDDEEDDRKRKEDPDVFATEKPYEADESSVKSAPEQAQ
jgi:hypothetical protein